MNIKEIISASGKPALYEKGNAFMWTDPYISKQVLDIHLNPDIDLGSRKMSSIQSTAQWILDHHKGKEGLNILDLGCGPGLYAEIFANLGHHVTGVDISGNSIEHARKSAFDKGLDITYIQGSYLDLELEEDNFDLVLLIYTDLGVLVPEDREKVLKTVFTSLKPGGQFIFDVLRDNDLNKKTAPRNWDAATSGFWSSSPYLVLSDSFLYEDEKVILYQHIVTDENGKASTYRFWTHFFNFDDLTGRLEKHGFQRITHHIDVLPETDLWNGDNVIFTIASK